MPIVFSAITPHSPLLIPAIGKENLKRLKKTEAALKKLADELYASNPDTILIISPHGKLKETAFNINLSPEYLSNFEEFGDFVTKFKTNGDIGLAHKIRERMETRAPLQLSSESNLDHGSSIPLFFLSADLPKIKIIPLYYSGLDLEAHFKFGQLLKRELIYNKERVAVIASGELSHRLSKSSPAGYSPKGKKFDQRLIEYLLNSKTKEILSFDQNLISEVSECGLKSIVILMGIMGGMKYEPEMLSYEYPFGIGYLVMNFKL